MSGKVLISPSELSDLMKAEPVVLIDTRDPAIYAEAHIPGAVDVREVFTYLASSTPEGMAALRDTFAAAFGKAGLSGAETAVIYEQSMSAGFGQSCRGYVLLRYLGLSQDTSSPWRLCGLGCSRLTEHDDGADASREGVPHQYQRNGHFGRLGDNESGR